MFSRYQNAIIIMKLLWKSSGKYHISTYRSLFQPWINILLLYGVHKLGISHQDLNYDNTLMIRNSFDLVRFINIFRDQGAVRVFLLKVLRNKSLGYLCSCKADMPANMQDCHQYWNQVSASAKMANHHFPKNTSHRAHTKRQSYIFCLWVRLWWSRTAAYFCASRMASSGWLKSNCITENSIGTKWFCLKQRITGCKFTVLLRTHMKGGIKSLSLCYRSLKMLPTRSSNHWCLHAFQQQ